MCAPLPRIPSRPHLFIAQTKEQCGQFVGAGGLEASSSIVQACLGRPKAEATARMATLGNLQKLLITVVGSGVWWLWCLRCPCECVCWVWVWVWV